MLVLDPLNATLIGGPAIARGAQKGLQAIEKVNALGQSTDKLLKLSTARALITTSKVLSQPAKGVRAGVASIRAGVSEGVTHKSLALFLMGAGRGGSALLGSYRKAALATTGAQLAVNLVDELVPDNSAVPGPLNDLFLLGREMRDDTPLSDSSLFNLWAVMHMPAREMIGQATGGANKGVRYFIPKGRDIEARLVDVLEPGPRNQYAARVTQMIERFGGADSYLDFLRHIHGKWFTESDKAGGLAAALFEKPTIRGLVEARQYAELANQLVDSGIKFEPISGRDFVTQVKQYATGARNVRELANGLEQRFHPDTVYNTWSQFRTVASSLDATSQGAAVPAIRRTLVKEHLEVAKARFRKAAKDGKVDVNDAQQIINDYPGLWDHEATGQFWSAATARGAESLPVGSYIQRLTRAQKDAYHLYDILAPEAEWVGKAFREAENRKGYYREDGTLDLDRLPTESGVRVTVPTNADINAANAGFPAETLSRVTGERSKLGMQSNEIMSDLEAAGMPIIQSTDGINMSNGHLTPAIDIMLDNAGPQTAMEVAALVLRESGSRGAARVTISGVHMDTHNLTPNAMETAFHIGGHSEVQQQQVLDLVNRLFGDGFINDTSGVYRIYIPESQIAASAGKLDMLGRGMAAIFPDKAPTGILQGRTSRVWTETVRDTSRSRSGRAARAAGTERSIADVERDAQLSTNWHVARNRIDARKASPEWGRTAGVVPESGPDAGPIRQPAGPEGGTDLSTGDAGRGVADGPVFYHGSGRDTGRSSTGISAWDDNFFVTHDPEIAGLYGRDVREVRLRPDAKIVTLGTPEFDALRSQASKNVTSGKMIDEAIEMVRLAREQGIDVVDFRKDFIGAVVVNEAAVTAGGRSIVPSVGSLSDPPATTALKGELRYALDRDAEVAAFHPRLGEYRLDKKGREEPSTFESWSPEEQQVLSTIAEDVMRYQPAYTLSVGPKGSTPFRIGQGKAYAQTAMAKQVTGDLISSVVTSKAANFWHGLFGRVYTKDLANDAKQELFSDFLAAGASTGETAGFMRALSEEARNSRLFHKTQLWHRMDLLPRDTINRIAREGTKDFKGFKKATLDKLGGTPDQAMIRASSRFYRKLEQNHRAVDGKRSLSGLLDKTYGPMTQAAEGKIGAAGNMIRAFYPLIRFKLDPRWHLMNWYEADIIGAARYGIRRGETIADHRAVGHITSQSVDSATNLDSLASGFLDARRLEAYIAPAFRQERVLSTRAALKKLAEDDPIMVMLRKRHGKPGATADDLVNELDRMMYDFDTIGVRQTIDNTVQSLREVEGIDILGTPGMPELIQQLTKAHKQQFSEVVRSFHGNVNRSNVERMLNSYFLYWPISYQLKSAKTLFDVLTKGFGGRKTDLLGAWTYQRIMDEHKERLVSDESYRKMFEDHPELWRAAGMFLPITPEDIGISASRISRYGASSLGAAVGLWGKDADYPDLTSPMGVIDAGTRIANLGLPYSIDLLKRVAKEFKDDQ